MIGLGVCVLHLVEVN